jgi:hypothetical protein
MSASKPGHGYGTQRLLPASHRDLHEDHSLTRQGQHLQPSEERRNQRGADRTVLRQASAALTRDGQEPAEFWGELAVQAIAGTGGNASSTDARRLY